MQELFKLDIDDADSQCATSRGAAYAREPRPVLFVGIERRIVKGA